MRNVVVLLVALLFVLHQDFWWWHSYRPLVCGFIPISLAYHAGISIAAAIVWGLASRYCWPHHLDDDEPPVRSGGRGA